MYGAGCISLWIAVNGFIRDSERVPQSCLEWIVRSFVSCLHLVGFAIAAACKLVNELYVYMIKTISLTNLPSGFNPAQESSRFTANCHGSDKC